MINIINMAAALVAGGIACAAVEGCIRLVRHTVRIRRDASTLTLSSSAGFSVGDSIIINGEVRKVVNINDTTSITILPPCPVSAIAWRVAVGIVASVLCAIHLLLLAGAP